VTELPTRPSGVRRRLSGSFVRYVLVGGFNTLLDLGLFTVFAVVFKIQPLIANVCSTTITLCISYLLNRVFVFRTQRSVQGTVVQFVAITLFSGLVIQSGVIWLVLHIGAIIAPGLSHDILAPLAKVCAMGVGMISNYLGYRWLFAHRPPRAGKPSEPAGPSELAEPAEPADPVEPAEQSELAERSELGERSGPPERAKPAERSGLSEPAEPAEPGR
jgi:putative flippase GtrA